LTARITSKPGSKIIGLYHLDSLRCYRTGDPDRPVIYQDLRGNFHYLTWWQVWDISDTPNARNIITVWVIARRVALTNVSGAWWLSGFMNTRR
jgi:hypothetical protein